MQSSSILTRENRIVVVDSMLTGTTEVIGGAALGVAAMWLRLSLQTSPMSGSGMILQVVAGVFLVLTLVMLLRRDTRARRRAIADVAGRQAMTLAPIRIPTPTRPGMLVSVATRLLISGEFTMPRLVHWATMGLLVLPALLVIGNLRAASAHDVLVFTLAILGPALVARTQLMAVGAVLMRAEAEPSLNQVMFPGR